MQLIHTWTDLYSCWHAEFVGAPGGQSTLVVASPAQAQAILDSLLKLEGKGRVEVLFSHHTTPLDATLRERPAAAVVVVNEQALAAGPALQLEPQTCEALSGLRYLEGGTWPGWQGTVPRTVPRGTAEGSCPAASVAAAHHRPVQVVEAAGLQGALTPLQTQI